MRIQPSFYIRVHANQCLAVPERGSELDLDVYIRRLAEIPDERGVHYVINGARHDKLGKWNERNPPLSPYTSHNYVIMSD